MALRRRSISLRIFILVLIPLLSLIGLYAFVVSLTVGAALNQRQTTQLKNVTGYPVGEFQGQVGQEATMALIYLAAPQPEALRRLNAAEAKTNQARATMRAALASKAVVGTSVPEVKHALAALSQASSGLAAIRSQVGAQSISRLQALSRYGAIARAAGNVLKSLVFAEKDPALVSQSLALTSMGETQSTLVMENALVSSDMAARSFSAADRHEFAELVGARRAQLATAESILSRRDRSYYAAAISSHAQAALNSMEDTLISSRRTGGPHPVLPAAWEGAVAAVSTGFTRAGMQAANAVAGHVAAAGRSTYLRLWLAGGIGLAALLLSVFLSIWIGRGLARQLGELRRSALTLATERLPAVMARLRAGEAVDVPAEAPPIQAGADEIGQVSEAFNAVQRTAVEAAVDQARLRRGVSDVFRSLARRSQSLLHRQLTLLDAMERRANDPEELDDLYRLDHLTTRMRRHAEGLVILSGAAPARSWRKPVRLVDVLRAAVAEIEDYPRVSVVSRSQAALAGPAVADIIHMLAELAENATLFSPPNTPVRLYGDVVGRGFAVEIEDRGLGLTEDELAGLNERLIKPPEFDLSDSDQLGLFVAGRLAQRQGIAVTLRPNPYGGVTAVVLIPRELIVPQEDYAADTGTESAVLPTGRHAARSALLASAKPSDNLVPASPGGSPALLGPYPAGSSPNGDNQLALGGAGPQVAEPEASGPRESPAPREALESREAPEPREVPEPPEAPEPVMDCGNGAGASQPPATIGTAEESCFSRSYFTGEPDTDGSTAPLTGVSGLTEEGLPQRIRQASLAPQLCGSGPEARVATGSGADEFPSPEQVRGTMTAIQRGWERGRSVAGDEPPCPDGSYRSPRTGEAPEPGTSAAEGGDDE
jgi:Nitrate and nitrite sensing